MADELLDLARRVVERAEGDEAVEAYALREVTTRIDVRDAAVDTLASAEARGVGVRVIGDGRQGYAWTADVTDAGLAEAVAAARANARVATPDAANVLPAPSEVPTLEGLVAAGFADTPVEDRIDLALALEESARSADDRVRGIETAQYQDAHRRAALVSTRGLALTQERSDAWAYVNVLAGEDDQRQTGLGLTLGRGPRELDVEAAGSEGALRATRLLGARKPRSRRCAVVFDPFVTAQFLGVLGAALSADAVLKGRSLFADRLGESVGAADLTLVDDGLRPGAPGTAPWDGEGVPQERTVLIDGGVLSSYLHTTWTARRTGGDARSTGNAARAGFQSSPALSPTNLHLVAGERSAADVVGMVDDGVYVQDVMGLHSGANPISGEFSVSFSGLAIRDGQLAEPIREAAVSSTIVDILRGVEAVAGDLRFYPFGGSLGGTTTLVAEMSVSGE
jgi:PmbA protein